MLKLFLSFAQIGLLTFGGGYAMLPMLQREVVEKNHWATEEELMDYYAIGQCTPGIIAVNTATFIGNKQKGKLGGIVATLGVIFPSVVIITVLSTIIKNYANNQYIVNAFAGIRVCVCILIFNAVLKLWKKAVTDKMALAVFLMVFTLSVFTEISPILCILAVAIFSLVQAWKENSK